MMREMTAKQFDEWIAYYQIEPFGILAEDTIAAHWKAIYANKHRKRGKQAMKVKEFLCFTEKEVPVDDIFENEDEEWKPEI